MMGELYIRGLRDIPRVTVLSEHGAKIDIHDMMERRGNGESK